MKSLLPLGLSILCFMGCSSPLTEETYREIQVEDVPKEIRIPSALWERIEGKEESHGDAAAPTSTESESSETSGALFMPVNVILREKTPGVLTEPLIRIVFPRGGGQVDFASYTTGKQGSFYVKFEWPEAEKAEDVSAWYDSKARRRKLDDGFWGAGCGRFYEITRGLKKEMSEEGLKVNTTRERHLTVLGGHFVFAMRKSHQNFVTQVTFKDSRLPVLFCEEL
ncbi:MAG TPA: hypothetical protein PL182_05295 [Pseudobdellovibrionaceae bacterium]|nr:hypothetical protein [Pseudobdellovibrionaceae bacterium]